MSLSHPGKLNPAYKHGHNCKGRQSPTYMSWYAMLRRCYGKKTKDFSYYGKRKIRVCLRWKNSFINFLEDMGERPKNMTLDRLNVNKGYCPKNCKWSSRKEQVRNRRRDLMGKDYIVNGKKLKAFEVQEKYGIKKNTFYGRIYHGLPVVLDKELKKCK